MYAASQVTRDFELNLCKRPPAPDKMGENGGDGVKDILPPIDPRLTRHRAPSVLLANTGAAVPRTPRHLC